ncbi:helix-turn-helix transcriptional regulator [Olivibacter sp. SDN3]|uniref:helix-turn-helix transcriptional regulator n=1 Tax=Olivibacter sp. SDN3 TaxID=2764720 RepID=UPI001650F4EF|nr:helix-turn-helix transcriptional regulator [Olivibacter sp. SDN3]QNL47874.1 helix-turn-helix transcriptional regulator [Olivibacter sp. SDN3]
MMEYRKFAPPTPLIPYVRYFWTLDNRGDAMGYHAFTTIADGLPGLIFQQLTAGRAQQQGYELPTCYLYGQSIQPSTIIIPSDFRAVGVYFYPNALQSIFGLPAFELTDQCLAIDTLDGKIGASLIEQLMNAPTADTQIGALADYLHQRIVKNVVSLDAEAVYASRMLVDSGGRIQLRELRKELRISERSFQRKFQQAIGISPKLFSRICQFQAAMQHIREGRPLKFTDLALAHGYADQSHFIRTFQAFVGCSPRQFAHAFKEQLPNFPHLIR